jgi:hypothetical protein
MTQTLRLPDDLFDRLLHAAQQQGLSIEQLLAQWVAARTPAGENVPAPEGDDDLLIACTRALLEGTEPPIAVNWNDVKLALDSSEPFYLTVEEAMSASRRRPWTKDGDAGD